MSDKSRGPVARVSRSVRLLAATASATLVLVGVVIVSNPTSAWANAGRASAGSTLVVAESTDAVVPYDPAPSLVGQDWQIFGDVYDTLVQAGSNLNIEPDLATSWTKPNGRTYVFNIRQGVRFSNGREMTVHDVVGSLKRLISPKIASFWAGQLGQIESITTSGPWKVKVVLKVPDSAFVPALANTTASILPMKELNAGTFNPDKQLLGTGPWKVASHQAGISWKFVRNPYYWRKGYPKADTLIIKIIPAEPALIAALRNGSVDAVYSYDTNAPALLRGIPNVKEVVQTTPEAQNVFVNTVPGTLFSNPKLREALSLAINRQEIIKLAQGGYGLASAAVAPQFGVCPASAMPYAKPNVSEARSLVAAAGATGKTVTIIPLPETYFPISPPSAEVLAQNLNAIGLKTNIVDFPLTQLPGFSGKSSTTWDLEMDVFAGYADPAMTLLWWNPGLAHFDVGWLHNDTVLDSDIAKSYQGIGSGRVANLLATCKRINQDANMIPLTTVDETVAYRTDKVEASVVPVEGYNVPYRGISGWTVK